MRRPAHRSPLPLIVALVLALPLLLLVVPALPCLAHVRFVYNTDAAGTSGFLTYLKVPHGCVITGVDNGENPPGATEAATREIEITVPAIIGNPLPVPIPSWNLTKVFITSDTPSVRNISVFTYTASPGSQVEWWQALLIPIVMDLPASSVNSTKILFPTVQRCLGGWTNYWNATTGYTPPFITVTNTTGSSQSTPTTTLQTVVVDNSTSSNSDTALAAIVIACCAPVVLLVALLWLVKHIKTTWAQTTSKPMTELSSPLRV